VTVEADETFITGIDPEGAAHAVEDAGFNGAGRVVGIGVEEEPVAAVFIACELVEERVGQEGKDAAYAVFVFSVLLAPAGLLLGRTQEMLQAGLFPLTGLSSERRAVGERLFGDGALGGFDLLVHARFGRGVALNPIAPKAVGLVVIQFVVDNFADELVSGNGCLDGVEGAGGLGHCEESDGCPGAAHAVTGPILAWMHKRSMRTWA